MTPLTRTRRSDQVANHIAPQNAHLPTFAPHTSNLHATSSQRYCLVVVPTYNESANIEQLLTAILTQGPQFDVLVVDDNSPDGTAVQVAAFAARTERVQLLKRSGKLGLGSAYIAGFCHGLQQNYPYLIQMDADFSHNPEYLPQLLAAAESEADVVLGSRNISGGRVENWSWRRKVLSRGGSFYARTLLRMPIYDCTGGFKCMRADVLRRINLDSIRSNGYAFQVEVNYRCHQLGYKLQELPIVFHNRFAGQSKMSSHIIWEAMCIVWQLQQQVA